MRTKLIGILGTLGLLSAAPAFSAGADGFMSESAWRFGIGGGRLTIEADDLDLKGSATAWEVFGGFEFNRYLAIEAGYIDGGKAKDNVGDIVIEADTRALYASVLGSLPVGDVVSLYARAGVMDWKSDQEARSDGDVLLAVDVDGTDPFFGAGIAALIEGALLRLEYRIADLDDTDLTAVSLAIAWRF